MVNNPFTSPLRLRDACPQMQGAWGAVMRWVGVAGFGPLLGALLCLSLSARADILINISKAQQQLTVTVNGTETYRWPVSTGKPGYETPSGSFRAFRLEEVYFSKKYDDAPMPDAVFFHGGYAVHGTYEQARLGRPVSHGCVRLSRANAATLFALVREQGPSRTHVVVSDARLVSRLPEPRAEAVARAKPPEKKQADAKADRKHASRQQARLAPKLEPRSVSRHESDIEAKVEAKTVPKAGRGSAPELAVQVDLPSPPAQTPQPPQKQQTIARAIEPLPGAKPDRGFQKFNAPVDAPVAPPDVTVRRSPKPSRDVGGIKTQNNRPIGKIIAHRVHPETRRVAQREHSHFRRAEPDEARMRALYRKYGFKWEP